MPNSTSNKDTLENRSIVKAIGVFGSMRFFQMISQIIVAKFVAIFIGPSGIGLLGLLKNAIHLIVSITSFGFSTTSIKEIATPLNNDDDKLLQKAIGLSKRTSNYIGILGFFITILCSGILSKWIFNDITKFYWFLLLSFNFIILSKNTFYLTLMKGLRLTKVIAFSGVISSVAVAIVSLPIYYFYKKDGIIIAILLSNFVSLLVNIYLTKKVKQPKYTLGFKAYFKEAKPMLSLGVYLSINAIFGYLCHFLIKLFFKNYIDDDTVLGYYEVGIVILTTYVGTIFSVMTIDFYPRLTSFQHDNTIVKDLVNKQVIIGVLIVTPLILFFYLFDEFLIKLLYSKDFVIVSEILKIGLFSTIIKAIIWPLSFIILAKGNKSQYLKQELLGDFMNITFTVLLYLKFGLVGIGLSLCLNFLLYGAYLYWYVAKQYDFAFKNKTQLKLLICLGMGLSVLLINYLVVVPIVQKLLIILIFLSSIGYSITELNKQIDLIQFLKKKIHKQ